MIPLLILEYLVRLRYVGLRNRTRPDMPGKLPPFAAMRTTLHFYRVRYHNGHAYFTRLHSHPKHKVPYTSTLTFYSHGLVAW